MLNVKKIFLVLAFGAGLASSAEAAGFSASVKAACKTDFYKFCPSYKLDSPQLRACMRAAGGNISSRCIDALVDSGELPRKYRSK